MHAQINFHNVYLIKQLINANNMIVGDKYIYFLINSQILPV